MSLLRSSTSLKFASKFPGRPISWSIRTNGTLRAACPPRNWDRTGTRSWPIGLLRASAIESLWSNRDTGTSQLAAPWSIASGLERADSVASPQHRNLLKRMVVDAVVLEPVSLRAVSLRSGKITAKSRHQTLEADCDRQIAAWFAPHLSSAPILPELETGNSLWLNRDHAGLMREQRSSPLNRESGLTSPNTTNFCRGAWRPSRSKIPRNRDRVLAFADGQIN